MRRRGLLAAAAGAFAALPFVSLKAGPFSAVALARVTPGCGLYPISVNQPGMAKHIGELRIERFWPAEIQSTSVARWDFDLSLLDDTGIPRNYFAWQLRRSRSGQQSAGNSLRMRFQPGSQLGALATVQRRDEHGGLETHAWSSVLPNATLMVIATARASTGAPPELKLLRFDPVRRTLVLSSGEKRDFDALLIETS